MKALFQFVLAMDLTGSMQSVRGRVRQNNCALVQKCYSLCPSLEMGVIAIGDDPPSESPGAYMTKVLPLQRDWDKVRSFINEVPNACGGDGDECYELALNDARGFHWEPSAKKVILFIGDAMPHSTNHHKNPRHLDWKQEVRALAGDGITTHAIHCLAHYGQKGFWQNLAELGNGLYLTLDQFAHAEQLILGVAHHLVGGTDGLERYEKELEASHQYPTNIRRSFDTIAGRRSTVKPRGDGRKVVNASEFQLLVCEASERQDVRDFAIEQGLIRNKNQFKDVVKGNLFYAQTERTEELRRNHEVVIEDRTTGEMFSGETARNWLECPFGDTKNIRPNPLGDNYRVWIQTQSYTRKMFPGQEVMARLTPEMSAAMAEAVS